MESYSKDQLIELANVAAVAKNIDPTLLMALVENESSWNPSASRYEDGFYQRYVVPLNIADQREATCRATSFGLCQILGQTARELGFVEDFEILYDPEVNLFLGCKKLRHCLDLHGGVVREGLLAYNGGGDLFYPARVLARQLKYQSPATYVGNTYIQDG